jgi:hypothetical protein
MGDFDFWRWARILAIAAVAAYIIHIAGAAAQLVDKDSTGRLARRFSLLSLGTSANGVSELLLVTGLALSWGEPDRRLLGVICGTGAVSAALNVLGGAVLFTWPDSNAPQRWFNAGVMAAGLVMALAVTGAAWQWMASLAGPAPRAVDEPGEPAYVSDSPSPGPDSR